MFPGEGFQRFSCCVLCVWPLSKTRIPELYKGTGCVTLAGKQRSVIWPYVR